MNIIKKRPKFAILNGKEVIPLESNDAVSWCKQFKEETRIVRRTEIWPGIRVSTVFMGLNHNYMPYGDDIWFETMIFGGFLNEYQERYSTHEAAEKGHKKALIRAILTWPLFLFRRWK